jgi:hypothetical protein
MIYLGIFVALFIVDFAWARYIGSVKDGAPLRAASWAGFLYGMQALATISIVNDNYALIPAILGAFVGTYFGVRPTT